MLPNLRNLIAIGVARLFYPSRELQEVQVDIRDNETRDGLEHALPYGFAHLPKAGAECVNVFPAGDKGFGLVISVYDRRYRLQLDKPGEVALYDDQGQTVHLTRDGIVIKGKKLDINCAEVNMDGNINLDGVVKINGIKQVGT